MEQVLLIVLSWYRPCVNQDSLFVNGLALISVSYLTINTVGDFADQHCACFCFIAMATVEKGSQDSATFISTLF